MRHLSFFIRKRRRLFLYFLHLGYSALELGAGLEGGDGIGYNLISKMPKGGCLINTARKEVIDEEGLLQALMERPDLKYVTDVAPARYEEFKEKVGKQIFATPKKMGAETAEANINAGLAAARQIIAYFDTGCTKYQVN